MEYKCECGVIMRIAGGYRRNAGTRPSDKKGAESADGKCVWGKHTCHQCGKTLMIPEAGDDSEKEKAGST